MADDGRNELISRLLPASFRGVRFFVRGIATSGGRKATERPIVNSDEQAVDDVGKMQRIYDVGAYVTAIYESTANDTSISVPYAQQRDLLLAALEDRTPASFVHPIEGRIDNLVARSWMLDESMTEVGIGYLSIQFIRETLRPVVIVDEGHEEAVASAATAAEDSLLDSFADRWGVDLSFVDSFSDAYGKVTDAYSKIEDVARTIETSVESASDVITEPLGQFAQTMSRIQSSAASVTTSGVQIALSLKTAFSALNNVFPTAFAAFSGLQRAWDFGDTDVEFDVTAPSGRQRKKNFDAMNSTIRGIGLARAYDAATGLDFLTIDDIESTERVLDEQFQSLIDDNILDDATVLALTDLREKLNAFLQEARITARKIVVEDVVLTTPRVLAFLLYEDEADDLTSTIASLNDVESYGVLSGPTRVLTS